MRCGSHAFEIYMAACPIKKKSTEPLSHKKVLGFNIL